MPCGIELSESDWWYGQKQWAQNTNRSTTNTKNIFQWHEVHRCVVANQNKNKTGCSTTKMYIYFEEFWTLWRHRNATLYEIVSLAERKIKREENKLSKHWLKPYTIIFNSKEQKIETVSKIFYFWLWIFDFTTLPGLFSHGFPIPSIHTTILAWRQHWKKLYFRTFFSFFLSFVSFIFDVVVQYSRVESISSGSK